MALMMQVYVCRVHLAIYCLFCDYALVLLGSSTLFSSFFTLVACLSCLSAVYQRNGRHGYELVTISDGQGISCSVLCSLFDVLCIRLWHPFNLDDMWLYAFFFLPIFTQYVFFHLSTSGCSKCRRIANSSSEQKRKSWPNEIQSCITKARTTSCTLHLVMSTKPTSTNAYL